MKKILLVNTSPRKGGNSDTVVDILSSEIKNAEVRVFKMRDKHCSPCMACGFCQGKEIQNCIQKDDITELLSVIDQCDAVVIASPIYNHQMNSQAKLFIERWYPFFNIEKKLMSNTTKFNKKGVLIFSFWGSPIETIKKYAEWTLEGFSQIGVEKSRFLLFNEIPERGAVKNRQDYTAQLHELAKWLTE